MIRYVINEDIRLKTSIIGVTEYMANQGKVFFTKTSGFKGSIKETVKMRSLKIEYSSTILNLRFLLI